MDVNSIENAILEHLIGRETHSAIKRVHGYKSAKLRREAKMLARRAIKSPMKATKWH